MYDNNNNNNDNYNDDNNNDQYYYYYYMYIYMHVCMYICIYMISLCIYNCIYIYIQRERELIHYDDRGPDDVLAGAAAGQAGCAHAQASELGRREEYVYIYIY